MRYQGAIFDQDGLLFDTEEYEADKVIYGETVSAPGTEINLGVLRGAQFDKTYWAVVGVRANGAPVGAYSTPRPLSSGERRYSPNSVPWSVAWASSSFLQ